MKLAFLLLFLVFTVFSADEYNANLNNAGGELNCFGQSCSGFTNCCACCNDPVQLNEEYIEQNDAPVQNQQNPQVQIIVYTDQDKDKINTMPSYGSTKYSSNSSYSSNDSGKRLDGCEQNTLNPKGNTEKEMGWQNSFKKYKDNTMSNNELIDYPRYNNQVDENEQCPEHCRKCIELMACFYDYQHLVDFDPGYAENGWNCSECRSDYNHTDVDAFPMNRCCECDYDLCQICIWEVQDGSRKLEYLCPKKHPLKELNKKGNTEYICNKCKKDVKGPTRYCCRPCDYDLCGNCRPEQSK
jgi:hypothetical protein